MKVAAILLAAGKGVRFNSKIPKPLVRINGQPIIAYSLKTLESIPCIAEIIVLVNSGNRDRIAVKIRQLGVSKVKKIITGGLRRQDSVYNGLSAVGPDADLVLIHDGARPFVDSKIILAAIAKAKKFGAAIVAVPVKGTIKQVAGDFVVRKTLERDELWEAQTPQVFRRELILKAYQGVKKADVTDDASLVEKLGHKVCLVRGSYFNIKITTPEDAVLAEAIARRI
jgi:2-C-methyl-D-erythritol 4-phosphate cytidylyltransferase